MAWWEAFAQASAIPQFLAVLGMLLLAGALLYIEFDSAAHRAFALLLIARAALMGLAAIHGIYVHTPPEHLGGLGNPVAAQATAGLIPYFAIALPFLIFRFATVYPRRRTWFARTRLGPWVLLAGALAFESLYLLDHTLFVTARPLPPRSVDGQAWTASAYYLDGVLSVFSGLLILGMAMLAVVFANDYVRLPAGPRKRGLFLVTIAFLLNGLYDGTTNSLVALSSGDSYVSAEVQYAGSLAIVPALIAMTMLAWHRRSTESEDERRLLSRGLLVTPLPILSGLIAINNPLPDLRFVQLIATGFWRLWLPALVTYALVRHQLFDIDLKLKFALKQSTMAGLAFVGFVVLSETLEAIITSSPALTERIPERWSDLASLGIAVGLTYALNPVKGIASSVANRAMPNTENTEEYLQRKRLEMFRATLEGALEDGSMTEKETDLITRLSSSLGLSEAQTQPIIKDVKAAFAGREIGRRRPARA